MTKTSNLTPFDPETARRAARMSAEARQLPESTRTVEVALFQRQDDEIKRRGLNRNALIRQLIDAYLNG